MHILLTGRTLPDSLRKYADSITTLTTIGECKYADAEQLYRRMNRRRANGNF